MVLGELRSEAQPFGMGTKPAVKEEEGGGLGRVQGLEVELSDGGSRGGHV